MFLSATTVASYFDSALLVAVFEQMLKVFLYSCGAQSGVLFRELVMNWFIERWMSAA